MRDIYYKAKTKIEGNVKESYWVEGYYIKHITHTPPALFQTNEMYDKWIDEHTQHKLAFDGFSDWNMPRGIQVIDIIPETLCQYTGLIDVNKHRIYENDICEIDLNNEGIKKVCIKYNDELISFILSHPKDDVDIRDILSKHIKVIGNIHETKEE